MRISLTGAFGNVGLSTLEELLKRDHEITTFDVPTKRNVKLSKKYGDRIRRIWGDLRNEDDVQRAVEGQDVVIHVAAVIPPLADKKPEFAESVNVGGTKNIISAMEKQRKKPKLIFTSSIAIYGDRRRNPLIKVSDPPNPNDDDEYAKQKLKCEEMIKNSNLEWAIFRLTYIVSPDRIKMDPLMFRMPLDTRIEICHTKDVGLALANAVENEEVWGRIFNIAGGEKCRTTYRDYIDRMMEIFGLGRGFLPDEAFSKENFHCGYMDTSESQKLLKYQRHTLEDYFDEVRRKVRFRRIFLKLLKPFVRIYLLKRSPYYR